MIQTLKFLTENANGINNSQNIAIEGFNRHDHKNKSIAKNQYSSFFVLIYFTRKKIVQKRKKIVGIIT